MKITLAGNPGSGKTTLRKSPCECYKLKHMYMGEIFRELARGRGLTIREYLELGEKDPSIDKEPDDYQRRWGKEHDDFILEGRTSFIMVPDSIKIFLKVDLDEGARRIWDELSSKGDARNEGRYSSWLDVKEDNLKRIATDRKRYLMYYGVDAFDTGNFDVVVDSTGKVIDEVFNEARTGIERFIR